MSSPTNNHNHNDGHDHSAFDPGFLYREQWVQDLIHQIQEFFAANHIWMGVEGEKNQRVLDYACGDGTVSAALAPVAPSTMFLGIDVRFAQVNRYNATAQRLSEGQGKRMRAVQGDLNDPSPEIRKAEWFDFDVAVISMALHHVKSPVDILKCMAQRVKKGGTVIIADWLQGLPVPSDAPNDPSCAPYDHVANHDTTRMVEVFEGERIWVGFTSESIVRCMEAAGLKNVEVRLDRKISRLPVEFGGDKQAFYAKGHVA